MSSLRYKGNPRLKRASRGASGRCLGWKTRGRLMAFLIVLEGFDSSWLYQLPEGPDLTVWGIRRRRMGVEPRTILVRTDTLAVRLHDGPNLAE